MFTTIWSFLTEYVSKLTMSGKQDKKSGKQDNNTNEANQSNQTNPSPIERYRAAVLYACLRLGFSALITSNPITGSVFWGGALWCGLEGLTLFNGLPFAARAINNRLADTPTDEANQSESGSDQLDHDNSKKRKRDENQDQAQNNDKDSAHKKQKKGKKEVKIKINTSNSQEPEITIATSSNTVFLSDAGKQLSSANNGKDKDQLSKSSSHDNLSDDGHDDSPQPSKSSHNKP